MITKSFYNRTNSDIIGAITSSLCLLHCVATPFLFIAQTSSAAHHHQTPVWWNSIDLVFLVLSLFAVYWSAKNTSKAWFKGAFWIAWIILTLIICNEKLEWLHLPDDLVYIPALALIGLHLYNKKLCNFTNQNSSSTNF